MFGTHATPQGISDFAALAQARTQMIDGDHDVFDDGTVILKYAPGHTPGHQCLYVKLAQTGGILIAGDLYHYAEERTLHRMPTHEQTTATPGPLSAVTQRSGVWKSAPIPENRLVSAKHAVGETKQARPMRQPGRRQTS